MKRHYLAVAVVLAVLLTGCASAINSRNAENYMTTGAIHQHNAVRHEANNEHAKARDSWDMARRAFARAVVNAQLAGLPDATRAVLAYEYGRSLGVTCFFDLAETYLTNTYELDKKAGHPLYLSLDELALLMLDQGKYSQAVEYFESGIKELDKVEFYKASPADAVAYANFLDEYALALSKSGNNPKAAGIKGRASEIRSQYPGQASSTERTPYGKYCTNPAVTGSH
jgi:tetratricopeptide (TPR) repeat protein